MRKAMVVVALVIGGLVCCSAVFGIGIFSWKGGAHAPMRQDWPAGLDKLVKEWDWIRGYHLIPNDSLFYCGDTERFNEFLEQYAAIGGTPLRVVLHPGRGMTGGRVMLRGGKRVPFDWRLSIVRAESHPEVAHVTGSHYVVTVGLWLGGQVDLPGVKAPLNVTVKSGGEIEKFIAAHEARRSERKPDE